LDDGRTQLTQYEYNTVGNVTKMVDPMGRETRLEYAPNGIDLIRVAQKTGATTETTLAEFTYDEQHRPLTAKDAAGQTTHYAYNAAGQVTQVTDPLNQTTRYVYDALGYLTQVINPRGKVARQLTYDALGRIASETDSEGHTRTYRYDDFDRVTEVSYPDGTREITAWDKLDQIVVTDREGRQTRFIHDAVRNLIATTDPLNRQIQYSYYPNGQLKTLTDAKGQVTTWERDLQSRMSAKRYADGRQDSLIYENTTSRLWKVTDSLGQTTRYGYSLDNRPIRIDYLNARNATPSVQFDYDASYPRVSAMTDGTGTTQYSYRTPGQWGALRLQQVDGPDNADTVTYDYDALGRISARTVDASRETYSYDALNRTTTHNSALGNFVYTYLGETDQQTGLHLAQSAIGTDWRYADNAHDRRLLEINSGDKARRYRYTTTPTNRITQLEEIPASPGNKPSTVWNYTYDLADRLLSAQGRTGNPYAYTYDPADNLLSLQGQGGPVTLTVNNVNQLTQIMRPTGGSDDESDDDDGEEDENEDHNTDTGGVAAAQYDANGNLIEDGVRTYQWDGANRLLRIDYKATPDRNTQFRYDGLSRRVAIISTTATATTETRYLWCGESLCQARDATHTVTRRYYPEGELHPADTNPRVYYGRDHLGSVREVLALPNGKAVGAADYTPYGKPTKTTGKATTDFRYAGMFYLSEAGLYLTHYRVYDPAFGRWLSRDPIGENGGTNLYTYVNNNPLNLFDIFGLTPDCISIIIGHRDSTRTRKEREPIFVDYGVVVKTNAQPTPGINLDPRDGRMLPIKPYLMFEFWWAKRELDKIKEYLIH
jgi:RHS repeat-associated protein